jgi:hypothetical protein
VSRDLGFGQLDLGSRASAASRNLIGPRAVRWYKASPLPGLDRNSSYRGWLDRNFVVIT